MCVHVCALVCVCVCPLLSLSPPVSQPHSELSLFVSCQKHARAEKYKMVCFTPSLMRIRLSYTQMGAFHKGTHAHTIGRKHARQTHKCIRSTETHWLAVRQLYGRMPLCICLVTAS